MFVIDRDVLADYYQAAESASTNEEKKTTLEALGEYLFNCLHACQCLHADFPTNLGEFDRIFEMMAVPHPLFEPWASHFVLEAKNLAEKPGQPLVQLFAEKLKEAHCTVGVFLSMDVYTDDACEYVRRKFPEQHIFLLHGGHIQEIIAGKNLVDILRDLNVELKFKPKRKSISAYKTL